MAENLEQTQADDLQFDVAEPAHHAAVTAVPTCAACRQPIVNQYYALKQMVLCPPCRERVDAPPPGTPAGRFFKALLFGGGAALAGSIVWALVRIIAHVEIGLIAVAVGFFVGKAVRKGSGGRGGRGYQFLALALTYFCIAGNYVPDVLQGFRAAFQKNHPATVSPSTGTGANSTSHKHISPIAAAVALVVLIVIVAAIALTAPILAGIQSPIGLLIQGFALWEAWKFTRKVVLPITGPYQMGTGAPQPLPARTM